MSNHWLWALRRASVVALFAVITIVIVHALRHGWESVNQPGDWIEKAAIFLIITALYTIILANLDKRSRK